MGVCRSNDLEDVHQCNNMLKQSDQEKKDDFLYHNALFSFTFMKSIKSIDESRFIYKWKQLAPISCDLVLSQPIPLNDRHILIMPQSIKPDIDLREVATFLYIYDVATDSYSKLTQYPSDFPRGRCTTSFDKNNKILYIFTEKGYIVHYNMNTKQWRWDIIHGITSYHNKSFTNESCSVMMDHLLCVITRRQHISWNKNNKQLQILHTFHAKQNNSASVIYKKKQGILFLIGDKNSFSYSLRCNNWRKLNLSKRKLSSFGCVLTQDERYILIFGGTQRGNDYDDIFIIDTETNCEVRKSKIKCPIKGAVFACNMVEDDTMDLMLCGLEREWRTNGMSTNGNGLSFDFVTILKQFYCIEYVHLFHRHRGSHWKVEVDTILM